MSMLAVTGNAQNITVTQFYLDDADLTANRKQTEVLDQNGDKCALIRVQTTQKGFHFEVGSAGVQKVDDSHTGEIWVYVPYGVRHISIRHNDLGSLPNYDFPINIQKAKTYIMSITSDKVLVAKYDDTRKQTLAIKVNYKGATFRLNGVNINLDSSGEARHELSFGQHTYRVEAPGYYPKEGQITIDNPDREQTLSISDLMPIMGKLSVHVSPYSAKLSVDGKSITQSTSIEPIGLQIGKHTVQITANGYKPESRTVEIRENETTDIRVNLSRVAIYTFKSQPEGANIYVNNRRLGNAPCSKELTTGTYNIKATMHRYKDYAKNMELNSSDPNITLHMTKINNYKNEFYIEGNVRVGSFTSVGATIGGCINNINIEGAYLLGFGNSETIYWSGIDVMPKSAEYTPSTNVVVKMGYGFPLGTRFRLTPQIGLSALKLNESVETGAEGIADGANVVCGVIALRFSAAVLNNLALTLTPEYSFAIMQSDGYKALSDVSTMIKKWREGFNVKLGITIFF